MLYILIKFTSFSLFQHLQLKCRHNKINPLALARPYVSYLTSCPVNISTPKTYFVDVFWFQLLFYFTFLFTHVDALILIKASFLRSRIQIQALINPPILLGTDDINTYGINCNIAICRQPSDKPWRLKLQMLDRIIYPVWPWCNLRRFMVIHQIDSFNSMSNFI